MILSRQVPRWAVPLLDPCRYKGVKGGRGGGKSYELVDQAVEDMAANPNFKAVGIREIQRSIRYSVKALVESRIEALGVSHLFDIQRDVILNKRGSGLMIFQGMQDHTADSIKSLEDMDLALVDEANGLSAKSLQILTPTIRKQGSEIRFAWNPDQPTDAIDQFFAENKGHPDFRLVHVNIHDNPHISDTGWAEYVRAKERAIANPNDWATFEHVWHGAYNLLSERIIFSGKWAFDEFEVGKDWDGPYYGCDFGFAVDPTTFVECWVHGSDLYIRRDSGKVGLDIDLTAGFAVETMPGIADYTIRADSANPQNISYLARAGLSRITGVDKWPRSIEEGITFLRNFKRIVVHPDAPGTRNEMKLYRYKANRAGDILPKAEDADNHYIDAIRYALAPMIKSAPQPGVRAL